MFCASIVLRSRDPSTVKRWTLYIVYIHFFFSLQYTYILIHSSLENAKSKQHITHIICGISREWKKMKIHIVSYGSLPIADDASIPFHSNNNSIELTILFGSHPNRMNRTLTVWQNGNKIIKTEHINWKRNRALRIKNREFPASSNICNDIR